LSLGSQKYGFGIRDPRFGDQGSRKKPYSGSRIHGVKKASDPGSGTLIKGIRSGICNPENNLTLHEMPELVVSPHNAHNTVDVHLPVGVDTLAHDIVPVRRLEAGLEEGRAGRGCEHAGLGEGGAVAGPRRHTGRQQVRRRGKPATPPQ
jgi:hypothetical protein